MYQSLPLPEFKIYRVDMDKTARIHAQVEVAITNSMNVIDRFKGMAWFDMNIIIFAIWYWAECMGLESD